MPRFEPLGWIVATVEAARLLVVRERRAEASRVSASSG
jgi:hypothetical protein